MPRCASQQVRLPMSQMGQTRTFGDVGSMSGLPESGHGWAIYEYTHHERPAGAASGARGHLGGGDGGISGKLASVAGFSPRVGQEAPHVISMLPLVAAGIGIAIVPASLQRMNIRGVVYRRLTSSTHLKVPLTLVSRRGETSAVVRQFVNLVRRRAKDHHGT